MKKRTIITVALALVFGLASISSAKYLPGFKVIDVADKQVTIQKGDGTPIPVTVKKVSKYSVGDKVKYDADKMKLIKEQNKPLEGC